MQPIGRPCSQTAACGVGDDHRPVARTRPGAVDVPERRCGQGDEQQRVVGHLVGDGLAAHQPGPDHRERVPRVGPRTGRADLGAPVPARPVQHPERRVSRGEGAEDLPGGVVDRGRAADQPHRTGAIADSGRGVGPGVEGAVSKPGDNARLAGGVSADRSSGASSPNPGNPKPWPTPLPMLWPVMPTPAAAHSGCAGRAAVERCPEAPTHPGGCRTPAAGRRRLAAETGLGCVPRG